MPIASTTQTKAKLGDTVPKIAASLPAGSPSFDKTRFSMSIPGIQAFLEQEKPTEVVIVGIETQICVSQTALGNFRPRMSIYCVKNGAIV